MAERSGTDAHKHAFLEKIERQGIPIRAYGESSQGDVRFAHGDPSLPIALTGVTQAFVMAMVLRDIDRGALALDTAITDVLPSTLAYGLCVIDGKDHTEAVTVAHLLSGSSGIPDFFDPPVKGIRSLRSQVIEGDRAWSMPEALELARHYPGIFRPGAKSGLFSSTNALLMGELLKETTGMSLSALLDLRVTKPLGLSATYFFTPEHHSTFFTLAPINHKSQPLHIPRTLTSLGAAGGIVSTARDTTRFLHALWDGSLFSTEWTTRLEARPQNFGFTPARGAKDVAVVSGVSGISAGFSATSRDCGVVALNQWGAGAQSSQYLGKALT